MRNFVLTLACVTVAGFIWATMTESGRALTGWWTYTEKAEVDRGTYFRLKVDLTYKGEPQNFDIVVGCHVQNIVYKDSNSTNEVGLIPTLYGRRMSDGKGLVIRAPDACDGGTTGNGEVPVDFTPLIIVFEDADTLQLGAAYLSDDAYDGPLSQLKFGKATVEAATRAEFDAFRKNGPANLIEPAQYKPWLDETKTMQPMALDCFAVERYLVPQASKEKLMRLRSADTPRFWWPAQREADDPRFVPHPRDDGGEAHALDTYMHGSVGDMGVARRNGGGVIRWKRYPASYYPISIPEVGLPEGHASDGLPTPQEQGQGGYYTDVHVEDGRYRGFAYCFWPQDYAPQSKASQRIDGEVATIVPVQSRLSVGPLFDESTYFYRYLNINLDSTRGGV